MRSKSAAPVIRVVPRQLQFGIREQAQEDDLGPCALVVAACVSRQAGGHAGSKVSWQASGPFLAGPLGRIDGFGEVEGNEVDELGFRDFAEERRVEVGAQLGEEVHDARQVALVVIRLLRPFESE